MARTQRELIEDAVAKSMRVLRNVENEDLQAMAIQYYNAQLGIIDRIRQAFPGETWTLQEMQGQRSVQLFNQIQAELNKLHQRLNLDTEQAAFDQLVGSRAMTTWFLDQATPQNVSARMPYLPETALRALINTPFQGAMFSQRYGNITNQMAADIQGALFQSMVNGESMQSAAERIEDLMGASTNPDALEGYAYRSLTIARTEIMRAQNLGRWATYDSNSDLMEGEPEWFATPDDRLCPWCLRREGMTPAEIKAAPIPAVRGKADPHGNSANMPLHPRCRCTWLPRLKSWKDLLGIDMPEQMDAGERGMRNEDGKWVIAPVEDFEDWRARRGAEFGLVTP